MAHIAKVGRGVIVVVGQSSTSEDVLSEVDRFFALDDARTAPPQNYRLIGTGAQILRHLNVRRMQLLSTPIHFNALSGFNLEITEFIG